MADAFKHYRMIGLDGTVQYRTVAGDALPPRWSPGTPRPVQVPRLPEDFEDWDEQQGRFVCNEAARGDHEAGPDAISRAHDQKALEALLINAGIKVDGMLAAEARALRLPLEELALQVAAKLRPEIEAEVTRRKKKKGISW